MIQNHDLLDIHLETDINSIVMRRAIVCLWIYHLLWTWQPAIIASSTTSSSVAPSSPVRHWEESWAASCAHGTVITMACPNYVLLLIRFPSTNLWKPSWMDATTIAPEDHGGLPICPIPPSSQISYFAPSWIFLDPNSLCAMTGFAFDVEHLTRVLQRQADDYYNLYGAHITPHALQLRLAKVLQHAAHIKGGRPYGIQALVVATASTRDAAVDLDLDNVGDSPSPSPIYTMDPSGSWQSWGRGATSIGRYAKTVRKHLAKQLRTMDGNENDPTVEIAPSSSTIAISKSSSPRRTVKQTLCRILQAWTDACREEHVDIAHDNEDDYQVVVVWTDPVTKASRLGIVPESTVFDLLQAERKRKG